MGISKGYSLKNCDKCKIQIKKYHKNIKTGEFLCYKCYTKCITLIPNAGRRKDSLLEALYKIRIVRLSNNCGIISTPSILIGKKVRLILVNEENE